MRKHSLEKNASSSRENETRLSPLPSSPLILLEEKQHVTFPYGLYRQYLAEDKRGIFYDPVYHTYVVLEPHLVQSILKDQQRFSSHVYHAEKISPLLSRSLGSYASVYRAMETLYIFRDGIMHHRLRTLTAKYFSPQAVRARRDQLWAISRQHLCTIDPSLHGGHVEACEAITIPYPLKVMCALLGIPTTQEGCSALGIREAPAQPLAALREWSVQFAAVTGHFGRPPKAEAEAFATGWSKAQFFFQQLLDAYDRSPEKRTQGQIIGQLLQEGQGREHLSLDELASTCLLLFIGGVYNTSNAFASALRWILQLTREQRMSVLADDEYLRTFVKECLTTDPSAHWLARVALERTLLGGIWVEKGQSILLCLAGLASGEPTSSMQTTTKETVPFGFGPHYCIGEALAVAEIEIGLQTLFERFPSTRMEEQALSFSNPMMRGLEALWLQM